MCVMFWSDYGFPFTNWPLFVLGGIFVGLCLFLFPILQLNDCPEEYKKHVFLQEGYAFEEIKMLIQHIGELIAIAKNGDNFSHPLE